jgi:hypothetical protein
MVKFSFPADVRFHPCPHCARPIALFQTYRGACLVLDAAGTLHVTTCTFFSEEIEKWHDLIREQATTYDSLLLRPVLK